MLQTAEIERDYVTTVGAARLLGMTRQGVHRLVKEREATRFPDPLTLFGIHLFARAEVLAWRRDNKSGRKAR